MRRGGPAQAIPAGRRASARLLPRAPLAAALLCAAAATWAHDAAHPRQLVLRLSPRGLVLLVDSELAAGEPARALRQAFDRDHSGTLDEGERRQLAQHLARTALLRLRLSVDGAELALRQTALRPEKLDEPASSTALLAVRLELSAGWPEGTGDWRSRRKVVLRDESPAGHVPVAVSCEECRIADASSGAWEKGEAVRGATTSMAAPLVLLVRIP